ncbi:hypothetical protein [Dapis sp. BLCC M229]|uniref:hypothetical protein n=1 Tax=Dapis sp. BLCC M229 TaxID=3400188 RepID=UPI003CEDD739
MFECGLYYIIFEALVSAIAPQTWLVLERRSLRNRQFTVGWVSFLKQTLTFCVIKIHFQLL